MNVREFLQRVITTEEGWFLLAVQHRKKWIELWYHWPDDIDMITTVVEERTAEFDLHFTTYLFSEKHSDKKYALPSRTIQADLDNADITNLPVQPAVLVETSPRRYQGYWIFDPSLSALPLTEHETLSRKLTYNIPLCDHAGWPIAHRQRIAPSISHKYEVIHEVKVVLDDGPEIHPYSIQVLDDIKYTERDEEDEAWITSSHHAYDIGPHELLESVKSKLPQKVYAQYDVAQPDRSAALWALTCAAFRAGLDRDAVYHLAAGSAHNKFESLQYGSERELAKDIDRAYKSVRSGETDVRGIINEARKLPGTQSERRQYIQRLVHAHMEETGEFHHSIDDRVWYVGRDSGRPIPLSRHSEQLGYMLDVRFGLNNTETDQGYVASGLTADTATLPARTIATSLSHYDRNASALYVHAGKKDVYRVTSSTISRVVNGTGNILFQWLPGVDPFTLDPTPLGEQWCEIVFGRSINHVLGLPREQALVILRCWLLFTLFRNASISRPILAIFGQPGSGKSTIFRKVYALLYGPSRSIGSVTNADNFDMSCVSDPFVALDNVDTPEKWLPDRLALAASTSDIGKRKLWTDTDVVIMKRQAMVAVTAHAPKFGREDVLDRLLLITLERLPTFGDENGLVQEILDKRAQIWHAILQDVQKILAQPYPSMEEAPQFRVADFARMGYWFAQALGIEAVFTQAINTIGRGQKVFSLEEDSLLVATIDDFVKKSNHQGEWIGPGELWTYLETRCSDPPLFKKLYQNAQTLGKKLWVLQDALREMYLVEHKVDPNKGTRIWRIGARE